MALDLMEICIIWPLLFLKNNEKTKQKHCDFRFGPHQWNGPVDVNQNRLVRLYACFLTAQYKTDRNSKWKDF